MPRTDGKIVIDAGESFSKIFKFRQNNGVDPINFTSATYVKVAFPNADGTWTVLSSDDESPMVGFDEDPMLGNVVVDIDANTTALFKKGAGQNIEVAWSIDGDKTTVILERVLEVQKSRAV
jgi:WD40 repeat protein